MGKYVEYVSDNGYKGVLYGRTSFSIFDKDGKEVFHTGFRNINTYEELVKHIEGYPEFIKKLFSMDLDGKEEDDGI